MSGVDSAETVIPNYIRRMTQTSLLRAMSFVLPMVAWTVSGPPSPVFTRAAAQVLVESPSSTQTTQTTPNATPNASGVEILSDTQGVDFGPYMQGILHTIGERWKARLPDKVHDPTLAKGVTVIRFKIEPNGSVTDMTLDASTHDDVLNRAAWGALKNQPPLAPLPMAFTGPFLEIRILFRVNMPASGHVVNKPAMPKAGSAQ